MRSTGELLYLLMVIGGFAIFAIVLAWVERTWRPGAAPVDRADVRSVSAHPAE
jgi:hypothetical protein